MFFVYFLRSEKNNDIYIGSCEDVDIRLAKHNKGRVKSTKGYKPWVLLGFEVYPTRSAAVRQEKFYKLKEQRILIKERFT